MQCSFVKPTPGRFPRFSVGSSDFAELHHHIPARQTNHRVRIEGRAAMHHRQGVEGRSCAMISIVHGQPQSVQCLRERRRIFADQPGSAATKTLLGLRQEDLRAQP